MVSPLVKVKRLALHVYLEDANYICILLKVGDYPNIHNRIEPSGPMGFAAGLKHLVSRRGRGWVLYSHPRSKSFMCATARESNKTKAFRCFKTYMNMNHSNVNHLESRWRNSHVSVYHGPLRIATFWELCHLLSIRCNFESQVEVALKHA